MANYLIGTGIYDVTGPAAELGMLGMAVLGQKTAGIQSRLYSRAYIIADPATNKRVVIVSADIWGVTQAIKMDVVRRLKKEYGDELYNVDNVLLSGTHTHSGPGGYSHYALYNLTILGFDKQNFRCISRGMVESIKKAHNNLGPGKIFINRGELEECGWNRSPKAYQNNPKRERNRYKADTDKEMLLLKFVRKNGKEIGCLNWFAIHPSNRGVENRLISGDNKGYASYLFETRKKTDPLKKETFIAGFANANAGDVSGNVIFGEPPGGEFDFIHMQEFGKKQFDKAYELYNAATEQLSGAIDYRHTHVNMSKVKIKGTNHRTFEAALGVSMFAGSTEDSSSQIGIEEGEKPGALPTLVLELIKLAGAIAGSKHPAVLPGRIKKGHGKKPIVIALGLTQPFPLSPDVLPLQLVRIGQLVLAAIPGELTTMAGRRLKKSVLEQLSGSGIDYLTLACYANAYAGYITTKREYDVQHYEGASTHFGPYTLMAYEQEFGKLARAMHNENLVRPGPSPRDLSDNQRTFQTGVVLDLGRFGKVLEDAKKAYLPGTKVKVELRGAHPKNNLRIQDSFLRIEKKVGSNWKTIFTDRDPCTKYHWSRRFPASSRIKIVWDIPDDTPPGNYRIRHDGDYKKGKKSYHGVSRIFRVVSRFSTSKLSIRNSWGKPVEVRFFHPKDFVRLIASNKRVIQNNQTLQWTVPSGWEGVQVRFQELDRLQTLTMGESIVITAAGDVQTNTN